MKCKQCELNMHLDDKPPTLERVKLQGKRIGLPEIECEKFHSYYEANGWKVGRNNMKSWTSALNHWRLLWSEHQNQSKHSVYTLTKIMEAKQKIADDLKRRWTIEVAGGRQWQNEQARIEYSDLIREIKQITVMIASMK